MATRLFHFSETPGIERFVPRAVVAERPAGRGWLNGPLVWAVDEAHQAMYLFPRDCPRILVWPVAGTSDGDRERWFGRSEARFIAHIERAWLGPLESGVLYRYEFPGDCFEDIDDAGMWVSRESVVPTGCDRLDDLPGELAARGVELRVMESLVPLRRLWSTTTLHVSGIRLRNAQDWG